MEKRVRIKLGDIIIEMPERVALLHPHYRALLLQGSMETPQTETQTPSPDTETEEMQGSEEASEQTSPRKNLRRGKKKMEDEETQQ